MLEFICRLSNHMAIGNGERNPNSKRVNIIRELHQDLLHLDGKIPTLGELGNTYGVCARILNDEFKAYYGQSIYNYFLDVRLNEAHVALVNTNIPMKTIAINLGYSHVNHFISAFRNKFGYTPGSLRAQR